MSQMVRATGNYREMPSTLVREGELWPADDPVVVAHPAWFEPVRVGRAAPVVEQATAAPGEQRMTVRTQVDMVVEEIERLRGEALDLGVRVDRRWSAQTLREEITKARTARGGAGGV